MNFRVRNADAAPQVSDVAPVDAPARRFQYRPLTFEGCVHPVWVMRDHEGRAFWVDAHSIIRALAISPARMRSALLVAQYAKLVEAGTDRRAWPVPS